jgi:hypothetical protein
VGLSPRIAQQLRALGDDLVGGQDIELALTELAADVLSAVPSSSSLSLVLTGVAGEIFCAVGSDDRPVAASLAMSLSGDRPGDRLILRAGAPGAFLLFADAPAGDLPPGQGAVVLDADLVFDPVGNTSRLVGSLTDLRWTAIATGILIDQGFTVEGAGAELARRAGEARATPADAARAVASRWADPDAFDLP